MRIETAFLAASVLLVAVAAFAQDKPAAPPATAKDRLVVKARLKGVKLEPPDDFVMVMAFSDDPVHPVLVGDTEVTSGSLESVFTADKLDVPGFVEVSGSGANTRGGVVVVRDSLRGELDLGELVFGDEAPALVSGRVVTDAGKPVSGAKVRVTIERSDGHFLDPGGLTAVTDASGSFAVRTDVRGDVKGFVIDTAGRRPGDGPTSFVRGAKDVQLVASPTVRVAGTLSLPPGLPMEDVVVVMKGPPHGTDDARVVDCAEFSHGGTIDRLEFPAARSFRVEGLLPGAYDVRVKFRGATRPLLRLPDVTIDETTTRLPQLVVTELVRRAKIAVDAADGSPAKGARLWIRDKGDRGKFREAKLGAASTADVAFVADEIEVVARAEGTDYAVATAAAAATLTPPVVAPVNVSVTLPAGAPTSSNNAKLVVAFEWRGPTTAPRAAVEALWDDTDPRAEEKVELAFPASGPAAGTIAVPGWYQMTFRARRANGWSGSGSDLVLVAGPGTLCVPVAVTKAEIERLLEWDVSTLLPR